MTVESLEWKAIFIILISGILYLLFKAKSHIYAFCHVRAVLMVPWYFKTVTHLQQDWLSACQMSQPDSGKDPVGVGSQGGLTFCFPATRSTILAAK